MAQPYFEGSRNATMYGNGNYSVLDEVIDIDIRKDSLENNLHAVFKVRYTIQSPDKVQLPLLFLALYRSPSHRIKVNGKTISNQELTPLNYTKFPFISKLKEATDDLSYSIAYAENEGIAVRLDDLIYFNAPLQEGKNEVYIEYETDLGSDTYGFLRNYSLKYSLYPSKFWKSFGPIQVRLHLNGLAELTESNLGKPEYDTDTAKWTLHTTDKDLDIVINHKTSLAGKIVLWLHPIGIASLLLIGMVLLHVKLMSNYPKSRKYFFWLGIIVVPAIFYTAFFLSFDAIEWILGYTSKHGYVFLYVVTYPIFVLLYGLSLFFLKAYIFQRPSRTFFIMISFCIGIQELPDNIGIGSYLLVSQRNHESFF
ncbi:hypothetical protein [Sphingobacterium paucimobilis]|nr:hypothetical protein [Sphingobacterium paucimobilis]